MLNMCPNYEKVEEVSPNGDCGREGCWAEENGAKKKNFFFSFFFFSVSFPFGLQLEFYPNNAHLRGIFSNGRYVLEMVFLEQRLLVVSERPCFGMEGNLEAFL